MKADEPKVELESTTSVLKTLNNIGLAAFRDRVAALPARYDNILINAVERCEPLAQFVQLPRRTIKTDGDIDIWIKLKSALQQGPVIIK